MEEVWLVRHEGDLLFRYPPRPDPEAEYLARRLIATHRFVRDSLADHGPGPVSELTFGDRRLALLSGHFVVLAVFLEGRLGRRLRERMEGALRSVEAAYEEALATWRPGTALPNLESHLYDLTSAVPAGR